MTNEVFKAGHSEHSKANIEHSGCALCALGFSIVLKTALECSTVLAELEQSSGGFLIDDKASKELN